jgi:hypothetical protein
MTADCQCQGAEANIKNKKTITTVYYIYTFALERFPTNF